MPFEIEMDVRGEYLRVEVHGNRDSKTFRQDAVNLWTTVAERCGAEGLSNVLVVGTMKGKLPVTDAYSMYSRPQQFGWSRKIRLAAINLDEHGATDDRFVGAVLSNRGFPVRFFSSEEDAVNWLLKR